MGLSNYLSAVKGRAEELSFAKQQATNMNTSLLAIEDLLSQVKQTWPTSATSIEPHVLSCKPEIEALDKLLSELSQPTSSNSKFRSELVERRQKLTYPFNRTQVRRLEERIARVNSALQTALQITMLNVSIATKNQVQHVYDVLLLMSQSTTVQTQRTVACLPLMAGEGPEKTVKGGIGVPLDSVEAAVSLASKPSLLSTSIETVTKFNGLRPPHRKGPLACLCRPSRKTADYRRNWGYFSLSFNTSNTMKHLPGCSFRHINGDGETRSTIFTAEYSGLKSLLQKAFVLSFFHARGAGGRSIGASFTYYPAVDEDTSPTFRIMRFARMVHVWNPRSNMNDVERLPECCDRRSFEDVMFSAVTSLITCGVPLTARDRAFGVLESRSRYFATFGRLPGCVRIFSENLTLAEACGSGSLSLAVLAGDESLVRGIIRLHPKSIEEVDQFGNTPLHLAIFYPSCLRVVLEAARSLPILEHENAHGQTPLECAWIHGCKEATQIYLASGSRIRLLHIGAIDKSCQNDVLVALKQRRSELKQFALENLTWTEAEFLWLYNSTMLDTDSLRVQQLLRDRGVNIPSRLQVSQETPLDLIHSLLCWDNKLHLTANWNLSSVRWLMEHGVDYWTPFGERSGTISFNQTITPAHLIFAEMGRQTRWAEDASRFLEAQQWLVEKLLQVRVNDACGGCLCCLEGCTPVKVFLDGMMRGWSLSLEQSAWLCIEFFKAFRTCLCQDDLWLFCRYMTFEAIGLRHTCCLIEPLWGDKIINHTLDEIEESNLEQRALLTLLADLVNEFEQIVFEAQGGIHLIANDPEEFWIRRWLPRIIETLDELNGNDITDEERSAAEAIGVVWGPRPTCEMEHVDDGLTWGSLEWVMHEVEKIMNE
ncbi:hypothetical protein O1611_g1499 [Lasiodiplodia mahajangana]|uniref:Uncharacterized protein n=1 Tax=Lasiodiplodia mahajangana TaxID=1108764 RepID=A0ACC2JXI8_9PEZI|nr:hypothetical protein O1611_g1499 [Lasiodiplodia mahajangana]